MAREQWTRFGDASMAAGLTLFAAVLVLQAAAAFGAGNTGSAATDGGPATAVDGSEAAEGAGGARNGRGWLEALSQRRLLALVGRRRLPVPAFRAWLAAAALAHCLGVFSFFYLLSEGKRAVGRSAVYLARCLVHVLSGRKKRHACSTC